MPDNMTIFVGGVAIGCFLLIIGGLIGYWIGQRTRSADLVDKRQFLDFLRDLSKWTAELSGDVSKYQTQLSDLSQQADGGQPVPNDALQTLLSQIMDVNDQLQSRLDSAEHRLEKQTDQISSYLTEARTDGLTGLMNRRAFDKATDELFGHWQDRSETFSLGLIDIDFFKKINDNYGHPAGDEILKRLSRLMQTELTGEFCLARYGGEEFALLSKHNSDVTADSLERLREQVDKLDIVVEGKTIPLTISCGVSGIAPSDRVGNLVTRSDEALYASKLGGRNRVTLHDGTICKLITNVAAEPQPISSNHQSAADKRDTAQNETKVQERLRRIVEEESRRILDR